MNAKAETEEIKLVANQIQMQKLWIMVEDTFKEAFKMTFVQRYYNLSTFSSRIIGHLRFLQGLLRHLFNAKIRREFCSSFQ